MLTNEQIMVRESAIRHLDKHAPVSSYRTWLKEESIHHSPATWAGATNMGWPAVLVPEALGGVGLGPVEAGLIAQEMGRRLVVSPYLSSAVLATMALVECGNEAASSELLTAAMAGESTIAFACQNGPLHDAKAPYVDADIVVKNNSLLISGKAGYVLDGLTAEAVVIPVKTLSELRVVLVHTRLSGVTLTPTRLVDGRPAANIDMTCVEIPETAVLARGEKASLLLTRVLAVGRAILASQMLGSAEEAFRLTVEYLTERRQFGVPIGSFQALQHRAAHLLTELEITQSLVSHALSTLQKNGLDSSLMSAAAKAKANDVALLVAQECLQMHGGIGMTEEHDIGLYLKHIRVSSFLLGSSSQMRNLFAELAGY